MKSALSAWYFAAGRLDSRPCITTAPWTVQTLQAHVLRLRCARVTSKIGNSGLAIPAASRQTPNSDGVEPGGLACVFTHLGEEELAHAYARANPVWLDKSGFNP
ncbi:hypothetical protein AB7M17_003452 [Bradyrhizobium sp. USDA 377]